MRLRKWFTIYQKIESLLLRSCRIESASKSNSYIWTGCQFIGLFYSTTKIGHQVFWQKAFPYNKNKGNIEQNLKNICVL